VSRFDKPTIKILLYTDAPNLVTRRRTGPFSLGRMIQHLEGHSPAFARFDVRWESRYLNNSVIANNKLHDLLDREAQTGEPFDQIWFFGVHQINTTSANLGLNGGTRESELTEEESIALEQWMEEHHGGVLVTGDHANDRPPDAISDDPNPRFPDTARGENFFSLGRALGRCIPRASYMRDWEGDPTVARGHSSNTHVPVRGVRVDDPGLQRDRNPQRISHQLFDASGRPANVGQPHPLFLYNDDHPIQFLPDHAHEGAVQLPPNIADETIWKSKDDVRPLPQIVATGVDADRGTALNLIATYDGTAVNLGRIVADSSWHHYFNVNLENLRFPAEPGSPADQIGEFYANLVIWLCPAQKRKQMSDLMVRWITNDPTVLEVTGPNPTERLGALLGTGGTALRVLKRVASACEIHELLQMTLSEERQQLFETVHFAEASDGLTALPSKQLVLGYNVYQFSRKSKELRSLAKTNPEGFTKAIQEESINASEMAFRRQRREVMRALKAAERLSPPPDLNQAEKLGFESIDSGSSEVRNKELNPSTTIETNAERSLTMAVCDESEWEMSLKIDGDPDTEETIGFRNIRITGGAVVGEVYDEPGEFMSTLRGTCTPTVVAGRPDMSHYLFVFNVRDARGADFLLRLEGLSYLPPGAPRKEFRGAFRAHRVFAGGPFSAAESDLDTTGQLEELAFDEGDTGTGNGQQT
jgi:hypothetical protein